MKYIITGASRGIGKYLAEYYSNRGKDVYGTFFRTTSKLPANYKLHKVNLINELEIQQWINEISIKASDKVVLMHCAGINYNSLLHKSSTDKWMNTLTTNIKSSYLIMKHLVPFMRDAGYGRIVLVSSVVPQLGVPGTTSYSASKSALWGLAKSAATENVKHGITVNVINLGYFDIGMIDQVPPVMLSKIKETIPVGKLGHPEDIANSVEYIVKTSYLTGTQINLNGGLF